MIGAITVAHDDSDLVWVGTGSDGMRSNVIPGRGVYKSDDAGKTWSCMGLEASGLIGAVVIHPTNHDVVFVAAIGNAFAPNEERGVYRTRDGGASWERVFRVSATCGAVDLEFHPANPDVVYASMWEAERKPWTIKSGGTQGGVWRTADGGDTWAQLGGGLPTGVVLESANNGTAVALNRDLNLSIACSCSGLGSEPAWIFNDALHTFSKRLDVSFEAAAKRR